MMNVIKTRFFSSKDAGVKAVLTGKRQTRKPQNKLGQCGQGIKDTVALVWIMFSGTLVVVLLVLLMCRRVLWHGLCILICGKWFKKSARTGGIASGRQSGIT
ncbi:hypothetical protein GBF38_004833, partial [Nibea albiflora]